MSANYKFLHNNCLYLAISIQKGEFILKKKIVSYICSLIFSGLFLIAPAAVFADDCGCCDGPIRFLPYSVENGGTGATNAAGARKNLGISDVAQEVMPLPNPPDPNDITLGTGLYIPANVNLPNNTSSGILENKVMYNSDGSLMCILQYWYRYRENESWKRTYNTVINGVTTNAWTAWVETSENAVFNKIYPVGSVYLSVSATNPGTLFGGTWAAWGQGRVPLGMGSNGTTNYTTVQATGGGETVTLSASQVPNHSHMIRVNAATTTGNPAGDVVTYAGWNTTYGKSDAVISTSGGGASHNNMQPYITCYMWRRTA